MPLSSGKLSLFIRPVLRSCGSETISICDKYFSKEIKFLLSAKILKKIKKEKLSNFSAERADGLLIIISIKYG